MNTDIGFKISLERDTPSRTADLFCMTSFGRRDYAAHL
jgi:hypothetical protein